MLGFDLRVLRTRDFKNKKWSVDGASRAKDVFFIAHTDNIWSKHIHAKALEVISDTGYPYVFRLKAGDFPTEPPYGKLDLDDDEEVFVEMWDQS